MVITHPSIFTEIPALDAILKNQAEKLANELAAQVTPLEDLNGLMRTLMKTALERMLNTEMDVHLQRRGQTPVTNTPATSSPVNDPTATAPKNRRNGHSKKTVSARLMPISVVQLGAFWRKQGDFALSGAPLATLGGRKTQLARKILSEISRF